MPVNVSLYNKDGKLIKEGKLIDSPISLSHSDRNLSFEDIIINVGQNKVTHIGINDKGKINDDDNSSDIKFISNYGEIISVNPDQKQVVAPEQEGGRKSRRRRKRTKKSRRSKRSKRR